jgi:hypothetical protein
VAGNETQVSTLNLCPGDAPNTERAVENTVFVNNESRPGVDELPYGDERTATEKDASRPDPAPMTA